MKKERLYLNYYGKEIDVEIYMYYNDIPEIKEQMKISGTKNILNFIGEDKENHLDIYEGIDSKKIYGVAGKNNIKWEFDNEEYEE